MNGSQRKSGVQGERDPYGAGLVNRKLRIIKAPFSARPVGILTNLSLDRNLGLIVPPSRPDTSLRLWRTSQNAPIC